MNNVFNLDNKNHLTQRMFLDDGVNIQRYDTLKYSQFDKLTEKQNGFFWQPTEIDLTRDSKDFKQLSEIEQHIFTSNLKRQILLDSVQGRSPLLAFLPIISLPELETWLITWCYFETIHSRSYTHIIRNVYANPSKVFDEMLDIKEIVNCATDISFYYDDLINAIYEYKHTKKYDLYELKKKLWLCLMSVNALEGIRFYISFACAWAFAELKKMEGNAKIIKLISRDENLHLASTQLCLKNLLKDDPDFIKIKKETEVESLALFMKVVNQEKEWANYLFKDGSIIGLNGALLIEYIEWLSNKRLQAVDLPPQFKTSKNNPLPWTQKWIGGKDVQNANQEVSNTMYIIGGVKNDIVENTFSGMEL